ncbi:hypothetical protein ABZ922_45170 [Streptomyces shenzhenensis]|uniref:hypothetical protein n=1 Tax=Streptomyces shenzhenensis TaxID=943815 RepID=UPI0033FE2B21
MAVVATIGGSPGEPLPAEQRLALQLAVGHAPRRLAPAHTFALICPVHVLVFGIRPGTGGEAAARGAEDRTAALTDRLRAELPTVFGALCWGWGRPRSLPAGGRGRHL